MLRVNSKILLLSTISVFMIMVSSCKKEEDNDNTPPQPQEIVTNDTSSITGQLTVKTFYMDNNNNTVPAYSTVVCLYADYDDIQIDRTNSTNDLAIYRLITATNDNTAFFGYINYGNYYVWAKATINGTQYERISIVQVRPRREEVLNITMLPVNN